MRNEMVDRVVLYKERGSRYVKPEDDDRGSCQDCIKCGKAFFSRYEPSGRDRKRKPHPWGDLTCDLCKMRILHARNMELLDNQPVLPNYTPPAKTKRGDGPRRSRRRKRDADS